MDTGYLKIKIDIISEYEEYRKRYNYKRKELKKEEIRRVFEGFKDFFRNGGDFKFREHDQSITAEYKEHGITLEVDSYRNTEKPDFDLEGCIRTFDKQVYEIFVKAVPDKEIPLQPSGAGDQERMIHDTRYFQDFLNDAISYTYKYSIKERDGTYGSMQELMQAL